MHRPWMVARLAVVALALAACASGEDDTSSPRPTQASTTSEAPAPQTTSAPTTTTAPGGPLVAVAPEGDAFYTPPDPLPGQTGDLIWAREVGTVDGGTSHLILYRSESTLGDPIAVSGLVFVPDAPAEGDGRAVFSWGNGTRGIADECANSRSDDPSGAIPILAGLLERGVVVVATDYEGLGTPGRHPYAIGASEAHAMLDAIRATQQYAPAEAGEVALIGGQSQGGHAMGFANELAATYAPELDVVGALGTSAGVLTVDDGIVDFLIGSPQYRGIMMMTMAAQQEAYGDELAPPDRLLTEQGVALLDEVDNGCAQEVGAFFSQYEQAELFREDWDLTMTDGRNASSLNEPGNQPNSVPMFLIHTRDDGLIPATFVVGYLDKACQFGTLIEIEWWDGGHSLLYDSAEAQDRALVWVDARLAGEEPVDHCADIPQP